MYVNDYESFTPEHYKENKCCGTSTVCFCMIFDLVLAILERIPFKVRQK